MRITAETTEQATRIMRDYGIELTNARTQGVEQMNDAILVLHHIFKNFARNIVADYAPSVKEWVQQVQAGLKPGGKLRETIENLAEAMRVAFRFTAEFVKIVSGFITKETAMTAGLIAISLAALKVGTSLATALIGLKAFIVGLKGATVAGGALAVVLGLGTGGLGAVFTALFAAGGLVAAGIAGYKALTAETDELAEATENLTLAKRRAMEADLRAEIAHAKSEARLQEIIAGGHGYISREQAIKTQEREIADLEKRLDELSGRAVSHGSVFDPINFGKAHITGQGRSRASARQPGMSAMP